MVSMFFASLECSHSQYNLFPISRAISFTLHHHTPPQPHMLTIAQPRLSADFVGSTFFMLCSPPLSFPLSLCKQCYDGIRISRNAWDSPFCAVNARFLAVVLEASGGGAFTVINLENVRLHCLIMPRAFSNFLII